VSEVLLSESFCNGVIATVESWTFPYQGNVANVAYNYLNSPTDPNIYARIVTIVQSSGMGKSRMVDEFSKEHFVIPLNLRDGNQGALNPLIAIKNVATTLDAQDIPLLMVLSVTGFESPERIRLRILIVSLHS
jgi:hypothetical protein